MKKDSVWDVLKCFYHFVEETISETVFDITGLP